MFNLAVSKAGLDARDEDTNRRELHVHSLRKFFRTNIGLDFDLTNALMGHTEYLDKSYRRLNKDQIDRAYLGAMANVCIYTAPKSRVEEIKSRLAMVGLSFDDQYLLAMASDELFDISNGIILCRDCHVLTFAKGEKNE